jgi:hypothetical protein
MRRLVEEYTTTYGESLIRSGRAEFHPDALERLAAWNL